MKGCKKLFLAVLMASAGLVAGCSSTEEAATPATDAFAKAQVKDGFIKGADVSTLKEMEDAGYVFKGFDGKPGDAMALLHEQGFNYIRLRIWVDPYDANGNTYGGGTNDLPTTLYLAQKAKDNGMKFLLDFHYSDFWTDPGKQFKPKAWADLSFEDLKKAVYEYSRDTIKAFGDKGLMPDMVQIGNELNGGMLWPDGKSWGQDGKEFDRLAELLKAGTPGGTARFHSSRRACSSALTPTIRTSSSSRRLTLTP